MPANPFLLYKRAYLGLSGSTWWLALVMLVNRSGTMVLPFMTIYLTGKLHYSIAKAGFIMGLWGLGSIAGALIGGWLTDKFGFYRVQLISLMGGGCFFILLGQMTSFPLISVFVFLLSLINDSFRPANGAAVAHYSETSNRTRSYSLNRLAVNLGWAVGGGLGGFIASHNYQLLFWVDGCTNLAGGVLLMIFLRPSTLTSDKKVITETSLPNPSPYRDNTYLLFILLTSVFAICFFQYFTTLPVYFKQELKLSFILIGGLLSLNGLIITFCEMILVYTLQNKKSQMLIIASGIALVGVSFMMLNFLRGMPSLAAFVAMVLITFGEMLSMPFMNSFWVSRTTDDNRGTYASLFTIAFSLGQILGPLAGSELAERFGFEVLWWAVGVVSFLNAGCFVMFIAERTGKFLTENQMDNTPERSR